MTVTPKVIDDMLTGRKVAGEPASRQLSRIQLASLAREERITQFANRAAITDVVRWGSPPINDIRPFLLVAFQSRLPVVDTAEVVLLTPVFLAPSTGRVGSQGGIRRRVSWTVISR